MEILAIEGLTKNFYLHNLGKTIKSCLLSLIHI